MSELNRRGFVAVGLGAAILPTAFLTDNASADSKTHTVEIKGFKYVPDVLSVKAGDKIEWINRDIVPHTATAIDESWDTGNLDRGDSAITVVSKETTEEYYCVYHPHMKAKLKLVVG